MRVKPNESPASIGRKLDKSVEIGMLNAFYGGLLTDKQREVLRLHYDEDLSLGEIAEQYGVSRQNVHELITRSAQKLQRYERALGGMERSQSAVAELTRAVRLLNQAREGISTPAAVRKLDEAMDLLLSVIRRQEGEEDDDGL